jgi:nucleotide-binding universal stress UspA family protein
MNQTSKTVPTKKTSNRSLNVAKTHRLIGEQPGLAEQSDPCAPLRRLKRLLVPIDFSAASHKALWYAVPFAEQFGATISLVHVVEPAPYSTGLAALPLAPPKVEVIREATEKLYALADLEIDGLVPIEVHVLDGKPFMAIVEAAKTFQTDLIIIATHGHGWVNHFLLGRTAEKVIRYAPCPVLIVRETEHDFV